MKCRSILRVAIACCVVASATLCADRLAAQSPEVLFQTGQYEDAQAAALAEVERGVWNEKWPRLLMQTQLVQGQYAAALETYETAIQRYSNSLALRMLAREALLGLDQSQRAEAEADEIFEILQRPAGRFATADNLVAAGRYFVLRREDARQILQFFYDRVRTSEPGHLEAAIATAELALLKGDFQVAAKTLGEAKKLDVNDPRIDYLLWKAFAPSDPQRASASLQQAIDRNPRLVPALLAMAESAIDRERYDDAQALITKVLEVNVHQSDAWALLAVIAHLRGQPEIEKLMRASALSTWSQNPEVDHTIGKKLSQNYRFAEGAQYQRQALLMDPVHPGANFQLAEDLLRLGHDDVGWELAKSVAQNDPYNVVAYNLVTLYDRLQKFATISGDGIVVRMDPKEAAIYGQSVIDLLTKARSELCEKYAVEPDGVIAVEIFPQQKDFAIRTFGLPGGDGFLGVCFGRVITANSPASQGDRPSNWESVLWHEFCHAVTLEKTKNRMPRWLSEGISVYEERQRNPASGESMTPVYRQMLLDDSLTPVSKLSGAFLNPPSAIHLQFAYYQSSLVIEFLVENYGFESILKVLDDLAAGLNINDALVRSVGSLEQLDQRFAIYARELAEGFGDEMDWSQDDLPTRASVDDWTQWVKDHPNNYWGNLRLAESLVAAKQYDAAIQPLEHLVEMQAITGGRGGPLELLADVYANLGQTAKEKETLQRLVAMSDDALPAATRLAELAEAESDWQAVSENANRILAIQPLTTTGHMYLADASEQLDHPDDTIRSLSALSQLDPVDPALIEYRTARAYVDLDQPDLATDKLLAALREAPRYRDALDLLLQITEADEKQSEQKSGEQ
jgi:tetratricopeptide (TPR) repeat protein